MKTLIIVFALSLFACATPKRTKANLAIDAEPSTAPADSSDGSTDSASSDAAPEGEIDLGLEGSSGPVQVEGAMSSEDEDAALANAAPAKKDAKEEDKKDGDKKKKADDDDEESDDEPAEDEESAEE